MTSVVIVGAGPAGATAALSLACQGLDVTLLEREPTFDRVFRGEGLMPLGIDALVQLGLDGALKSVPNRLVESWDMHVANRLIFRVPEPHGELGDRAVRIVSQPALLEHVVGKAKHFPGFRLIMNANVRELIREDGVVRGVRFQSAGETNTLPADLVLGCDGRGSLMRKRAGIELNLLPESYDVLWYKFPTPQRYQGATNVMLCGTVKNTALAYNSWDDQMRCALMLEKGTYARNRDHDWLAELAEPMPSWLSDHIIQNRDRIDEPSSLNVFVGLAQRWHVPGLLLLGDAAHPMSPIRAQGINMAFRDVVVAMNHLVPVLKKDGKIEELDVACAASERERLPEIQRAQKLQLREAKGQFNRTLRPMFIRMAKHLGPLLGRYTWAQRSWLAQQRDLRFGTSNVVSTLSE